MKQLSQTRQFAKDVKRMRKRGKDIEKLKAVSTIIDFLRCSVSELTRCG